MNFATHPRATGCVIPLLDDFSGVLPRLLPRGVVLAEDLGLSVHPAAACVSARRMLQVIDVN